MPTGQGLDRKKSLEYRSNNEHFSALLRSGIHESGTFRFLGCLHLTFQISDSSPSFFNFVGLFSHKTLIVK